MALGSLTPSQEAIRQIPAETEATVVRIHMLPGSLVKQTPILLEMSNPQVEQEALDAQLQWKAAAAAFQSQEGSIGKRLDDPESSARLRLPRTTLRPSVRPIPTRLSTILA